MVRVVNLKPGKLPAGECFLREKVWGLLAERRRGEAQEEDKADTGY